MNAQCRQHFSTLANAGAKAPTRPFTPYEVKVRETMRQKRRKHFAAEEAARLDPTLGPVRPWPGSRWRATA